MLEEKNKIEYLIEISIKEFQTDVFGCGKITSKNFYTKLIPKEKRDVIEKLKAVIFQN